MPADQAIAEEEENSTCALARVNVDGEVAVGVTNEVGAARSLGEVQDKVECADDVAQDTLACALMFHHGPLHEPADKADDECHIRAGVHQEA